MNTTPGRNKTRVKSGQKDGLICELRAENHELRVRDKDYAHLYDRLVDTEHHCGIIHEERDWVDQEMRLRAESDSLSISKLTADNGRWRSELEEKDAHLARLRTELDGLRAEGDKQSAEIANLSAKLSTEVDLGAQQRADIDDRDR